MSNAVELLEATRADITESIKEELQRKPLPRIRVRKLCREHGVKPRQFRSNFRSRRGFLEWVFYSEFVSCIVRCEGNSDAFLNAICTYFYENRGVYRNVLGSAGRNTLKRSFDMVAPIIMRDYIDVRYEEDAKTRDILLASCPVFVDLFREALVRWVCENEPMSPEAFAARCKQDMDSFADLALACEQS